MTISPKSNGKSGADQLFLFNTHGTTIKFPTLKFSQQKMNKFMA